MVFITTLTLAISKWIHLMSPDNAHITLFQKHEMFATNDTAIDLTDQNFTIAFRVSDFVTRKTLNDPNMVRWNVTLCESNGT